ncbi:type II toxin-antitoxin system Phd/YefM family antitoxin [Vibrio cincinnatiensis]|uniref:type II toxin-antitoxin system Phd/YefM family antitoxin n=1 Tax=Vibrio cincinnatiensis TaxID=675 RepID=UPI001EE0DAF7|nr:type II toxin-antitoxin system Phd/YefM family antitoxin [Vibrio cincinnatiensis]MCG3743619.1 type II toxin-antitoxin system Phd/YefM family antitoxin [Vibrio cincinnatiensis]MCG3761077.1 type II toxin-antitoxin system Phd/YefM family antitoxin [Vibrio cincinnatiensis]MCG3764405.1 type II toxin-antitoxin system Phd/YefM family antitoxin [Vibrio cincinnatiensis]
MQTLNANEAKTKFGTMLINIQSEPVEILKNGTPVAVVMSSKDYRALEELKMELVKLRFSNLDEEDLVEGDAFFDDLESGKYD